MSSKLREQPGEVAEARDVVPRWPALVGLPLSLIGLAVSAYLTYEHYTASASLSCPAGGGVIDCLKVTTSTYSKIHGIPVAPLGLAYFLVMAALQLPQAWRSEHRGLRAARLVWCAAGVGMVLWLVYAELFKLDAICVWCTAVHIVTVLLFVAVAFGTVATTPTPEFIDD